MLFLLCYVYPWARTIHVIVDNYKIHDSRQTRQVLQQLRGKIRLHFLPPYSPDENPIERVWKDFHDNVTRNHRYKAMHWLMRGAHRYLARRNQRIADKPEPEVA